MLSARLFFGAGLFRPRMIAVALVGVWIVLCQPVDAQPTDQDDPKFSVELAEILSKRCSDCHGGERPRRSLRIESYASLMQGSENGRIVLAGSPDESLLIQKLRGTADGDRMPPDGTPLSEDVIEKFVKWIRSGAEFDGVDPTLSLERLAMSAKRNRSTPSELLDDAKRLARKNWTLAFSDDNPNMETTEHFLIVARSKTPETEFVAKQLEKSFDQVMKRLGVSDTIKSPLTVYVLPKRYDFAEFGHMVEKRSSSVRGKAARYWQADGGVGYAVLGPEQISASNNRSTSKRRKKQPYVGDEELARLVTSLLLNRWGSPSWYAEGVGQLTLEATNRRNPNVALWKKQAAGALRLAKNADEIFGAKLPASDADAVTWAFARFLAKDKTRMKQLHTALAAGKPFRSSFDSIYGKSPEDYCDAWLEWLRRGREK